MFAGGVVMTALRRRICLLWAMAVEPERTSAKLVISPRQVVNERQQDFTRNTNPGIKFQQGAGFYGVNGEKFSPEKRLPTVRLAFFLDSGIVIA
jgi:hypothetical protein